MLGWQLAFLCVDIYQKNLHQENQYSRSHEVESAIPIAYSAWWNHQEDVGSIPTGDELSISDYRNLIVSRRNLPLAVKIGAFAIHSCYIFWFENVNTWNVNEDAVIFWSHEVESAIPIAYSAWWNHQEDVGSIPTGDELSISDYRNLIVSRRNL